MPSYVLPNSGLITVTPESPNGIRIYKNDSWETVSSDALYTPEVDSTTALTELGAGYYGLTLSVASGMNADAALVAANYDLRFESGTLAVTPATAKNGALSWSVYTTDMHNIALTDVSVGGDITATAVFPNATEPSELTSGATLDAGLAVTLTAKAREGYSFYRWRYNGVDFSGAEFIHFVDGSASIEAVFRQDEEYALSFDESTMTASVGGETVAPGDAVKAGERVTMTAITPEHQRVSDWALDGQSAGKKTLSYGFYMPVADTEVSVEFEDVPQHRVEVTASENGSVSPEGEQMVYEGDSLTLTATPDENYYFSGWTVTGVNGEQEANGAELTISNITSGGTINAGFNAKQKFTVTFDDTITAMSNGVDISSGETADGGSTLIFTATPPANQYVKEWTQNSAVQDGELGESFTIPILNDNVEVSVSFDEIPIYTVTATAGENGTIAPHGEILVKQGGSVMYTVKANDGYVIADLLVNDASVKDNMEDDGYTISDIQEDTDIEATFSILYTVTATAGRGGTISPDGETSVAQGGSVAYTITANPGYKIFDLLVNGTSVKADIVNGSYTISDIQDDTVINATFTRTGGGGSSGDGGGGGSGSGGDEVPAAEGTIVIVDGAEHKIGAESVKGDRTTATADHKKLTQYIADAKQGSSVIFPISENTIVSALLPVANMKDMADKNMTLIVRSGGVEYLLPAGAVDMEGLDKAGELTVTVKKLAENAVSIQSGTLVIAPMAFTVHAIKDGKSVEIGVFSSYVARVVEVTAAQAKRIDTAVVKEPDGTERHVPTNVYQSGGRWYAKISALTDSVYALIANEKSFADAEGQWFEAVVNEMASRRIVNGVSDTAFEGERSITRGEFAAILVRALGLPADGDASVFADVAKTAWYYGAVGTAGEYGLVNGKDATHFDPQANITRQEAMAMVYRAAKVTELAGIDGTLDAFSDADSISAWALPAARWNVGSGLIQGNGNGAICGQDNITRGEIATIVLRLLQKSGLVDVRAET